MRTKLEYNVSKEEKYNYKTDRIETHIKYRDYMFTVSGAKTREEHDKVIHSFSDYLTENGIRHDGFGNGTFETEGSDSYYLIIPVIDMEDKEYIKDVYKEWKKTIRTRR